MKEHRIDINKIKSKYTFYKNIQNKFERYFCSCGNTFDSKINEEEDVELQSYITEQENLLDGEEDFIVKALKNARMSIKDDVKCSKCDTNYQLPENQKKIKEVDKISAISFNLVKNENELILEKYFLIPRLNKKLNGIEFDYNKESIGSNTEGGLFFVDKNGNKEDFDLDEVFQKINSFFDNRTSTILNIIELKEFIDELNYITPDVKNIDSLQNLKDKYELDLSESGIANIKKIVIVYFSIIRYNSLSTIALTKDVNFLFDLLKECKLPKAKYLKEAGATSPLEIFNYLADKYFKQINEEISEEKRQKNEFTFKSNIVLEDNEDHDKVGFVSDSLDSKEDSENVSKSGIVVKEGEEKEMRIKINSVDDYSEGKIVRNNTGGLEVFQLVGDGKISKYLYKKINSFNDYKQLLKYLKLLEYKDLMDLIQKYEIELLTNMIDAIYFRENIEMEEIKRLIPLFIDHCVQEEFKAKMNFNTWTEKEISKVKHLKEKLNRDPNVKELKKEGVVIKPNYKHISSFDFVPYDDALMMLLTLDFDPRRHFYRLKTVEQLQIYHDKLVRYYNVIRKSENVNYEAYFSKFNYLETDQGYDGPLKVELLDTPTKVSHEGEEMHHSGGHYFPKILEGRYLMLKVLDTTPDLPKEELVRFTLGLNYNEGQGLSFDQFKSYGNKLASNRLRGLLKDYLTKKEVEVNQRKPDIRIK